MSLDLDDLSVVGLDVVECHNQVAVEPFNPGSTGGILRSSLV